MSSSEAATPMPLPTTEPERAAPAPTRQFKLAPAAQVTIPICMTVAFLGWYGSQVYLSHGPDGVKAMRAMGDATGKAFGAPNPLVKWPRLAT